jgi:hypothetical protein
MEEIEGIPIISHAEAMRATFRRFGLQYGDPYILSEAIKTIEHARRQTEVSALRSSLWEEPDVSFNQLWLAASMHRRRPEYMGWVAAYSQYLLHVVRTTAELDHEIKRLLLGDQLLDDVLTVHVGWEAIAGILDERDLDFFFSYYFCGEVKEGFLLEYSGERVCIALNGLGRGEEAQRVAQDVSVRVSGLQRARKDGVLDTLRVEGERSWFHYLGTDNWRMLQENSRKELIDSYSLQKMIEYSVLKMWAPVVLALTKVAESELNLTLIVPWRELLSSSEFQPSSASSKTEEKKIEWRRQLFYAIKRAATTGPELTLGQIQVLIDHFDDSVMDACTDAFVKVRGKLGSLLSDYVDALSRIRNCFHDRCGKIGIVDLRNASAHPRSELADINWPNSVSWLRQLLGTPPLELVTNARRLRELSNKALHSDCLQPQASGNR